MSGGKHMTTLITGGTGFIGAEVVRLLIERGKAVTGCISCQRKHTAPG